MKSKKTLVLGASANPSRYSYLAMQRLQAAGHPVLGIGRRKQIAGDMVIDTEQVPIPGLDTVTLYLNPDHQKAYYDYIIDQHPERVIFNPGAENPELETLLREKGIKTMEACTLVLLATGQY